ncbi:MAG: secretin N-terminal domain-containing protein [Candidatus Omnitrophota bacterium]
MRDKRTKDEGCLRQIRCTSLSVATICLLSFVLPPSLFSSQDVPQPGVSLSKEKLISLDLRGVEIQELLKTLSVKSGWTIIAAKDVRGRVNIFLNDLPFEDVLDVLSASQNLAYEKKGKIITVMSAEEYRRLFGHEFNEKWRFKKVKLSYAQPDRVAKVLDQIKSDVGKVIIDDFSGAVLLLDIPDRLKLMEQALQELDQPVKTVVFNLNYADPAQVKDYLSGLTTSSAGNVLVDERTQKIVVSDFPERVEEIERLVSAFDERSRQVSIQARIIQVTLSNKFQRGIKWEKIFRERDDLDFEGSFAVSPALSDYGRISMATLSNDDYTLVMDFLRSQGDIRTISRPQVLAVNNQEAKIMVGSREAYVSQTLSQAQTTTVSSESVDFVDVGIKLNVVPTIGKDDFITMKINPEISSVRETLTTANGSIIPILETSEAETVVKVKDGATVMIAGMSKQEDKDTKNGFPLLSRLPLLRGLFGNRDKESKNTELIVFLTPRIIRDVAFEPRPSASFDYEKQRLYRDKIVGRMKGIRVY